MAPAPVPTPLPTPVPDTGITRYARGLIKYRWPVLIACFALVGFIASQARFLVINDDYRYFFKDDDPQLLAFNELQDTYNKNDNILFVVAPKDGQVFSKDVLPAIEELTREAWQIPFSTRVDSITNFQLTEGDGEDLIVRNLVIGAEQLSDAQLHYAASDVLYLHALKDRLDMMLAREGRAEIAQACFDFLPVRAGLDLNGWADEDIFAH